MNLNYNLTQAYFSTRGRKTGSSRRALSVGSWSRPSFSPVRSSLRDHKRSNLSSTRKRIRERVSNSSLEVSVVEDEGIGGPWTLEARSFLMRPTLQS